MMGLEKDLQITTPEHKQQRSKRKHNFGTSSCEKDRKCVNDNWKKSTIFKSTEEEFPPLDQLTSEDKSGDNYTPIHGALKMWFNQVVESEKENSFKEKEQKSNHAEELSFKPRRRLALSSVTQKGHANPEKPNPAVVVPLQKKEILTDIDRLQKRQRQLDIGKNTLEYGNFLRKVPRNMRTKDHPATPDKFQMCSTRSWQGQLRVWRRKLHMFDSPDTLAEFQGQLVDFVGSADKMDASAEEDSRSIDSNSDQILSLTINEVTPL